MSIYSQWMLAAPASVPLATAFKSELIGTIAARRGVSTADEYRRFHSPQMDDLHDASLIYGMEHACTRIERAIQDREPILIYGDYDVDGVTSIVLLQTVLRSLGAQVAFVVPHRLFDGYGLKTSVLDRVLSERAVKLVITVDCGISSVEPVEAALDRGIDVIITDHHLPPEMLPEAAAVLNPKQPGCIYPFDDLAGVGVTFKLCSELLRRRGASMSTLSLLKIAAIGTVADVAPLVGENRSIVQLGLAGLAEPRNAGLRALFRSLGILGRAPSAQDIGFKIGPRINAAGRLASADTAIRLFEARSEAEALPLVQELNQLNDRRKSVQSQVLKAAEQQQRSEGERVIVADGEGWHKGVVGLCAGKLAQSFQRPSLAISRDGDQAVGSARSACGINLHHELDRVKDLFTHFGGHEFACGFALPSASIPELKRRLVANFAEMDESTFTSTIILDGEILLSETDKTFIAEHESLQPFGAANQQPVFLVRDASVASTREFSPGCHEILLESDGVRRTAVIWPGCGSIAASLVSGTNHDLLIKVQRDSYASSGLRFEIVDAAPAGLMEVRNESSLSAVR